MAVVAGHIPCNLLCGHLSVSDRQSVSWDFVCSILGRQVLHASSRLVMCRAVVLAQPLARSDSPSERHAALNNRGPSTACLVAGARTCSMLEWRGPATPWALLLLAVWQLRPWRVGGATTWQIWCCTLVRCACVVKAAVDVQTKRHTHAFSKGWVFGRFCRSAWFLWQTFLLPHDR